jgi:hypothetical protein
MSNMLEQAIVDAAALKEAALKNAEAAILEKYAPEIKNAVDQLLTEAPEDEELGLEPEEDPMGGGEEDAEAPMDDLGAAPAYAEGEKLCPCPDEEEKIELDLDQLAAQVAAEEEAGGLGTGAAEPREDAMGDIGAMMESEELAFSDEQLSSILEELQEEMRVDVEPVPHGHVGGPTSTEIEEAELQALAKEQDSETAEENKELRKAAEKLEEQIASLTSEKEKLAMNYKELRNLALKMKDNLQEVSLSNARLVYTNRVLNSVSLNERQKK